jgi:hypothetical protein
VLSLNDYQHVSGVLYDELATQMKEPFAQSKTDLSVRPSMANSLSSVISGMVLVTLAIIISKELQELSLLKIIMS